MRSSIKIRAEAFRPPPGRLHEARQLAQGICDSVTDPHDWLHNYVNNHAARFAFDVAHTENLADGHSSIIIDVTAAPFVTSSLLARGLMRLAHWILHPNALRDCATTLR
jgi:hypothetical protein